MGHKILETPGLYHAFIQISLFSTLPRFVNLGCAVRVLTRALGNR